MDAQGLPQRSEGTPRLRKMVAGAAALRRKCALERTLFISLLLPSACQIPG